MLQQTDICIATEKEILMNGNNYLDNLLALCFFTRRKTGQLKSIIKIL